MSEGQEIYMLVHTYRNMMDEFAKEYKSDIEYIRGYFDACDSILELIGSFNKRIDDET